MENHEETDKFLSTHCGTRKFWSCLHRDLLLLITLNPNSTHARKLFKSSTGIKSETLRHLLYYRHSIHCFSKFRLTWEFLMILVYFGAYICIPYDIAFNTLARDKGQESVSVTVIKSVCLIDIVMNFLTGYYDKTTGEVVLSKVRIACRYVKFYFWLDLLSSVPVRVLSWFMAISSTPNHDIEKIFIMLGMLKLIQLRLFFKYFTNYLDSLNWSNFAQKINRNLTGYVLVFHILVCFELFVMMNFSENNSNRSRSAHVRFSTLGINSTMFSNATDFEKYLICFYYITNALTLKASAFVEKSQLEMSLSILYTICGMLLHVWILTAAYSALTIFFGTSINFPRLRCRLEKFMTLAGLSKNIQRRLLTFYDATFDGEYFRRNEINEILGEKLVLMVKMETYFDLVRKCRFFHLLHDELIASIVEYMREVEHNEGEVLEFNQTQKLYLIVSGCVAQYHDDNCEIAHFQDGSALNEITFLLGDEKNSQDEFVVVDGDCKCLVLNRSDFMKILAESPETLKEMRQSTGMKQFMATSTSQ